ncbi:hypothetical protein [Sulfurospirillum arcachonense]|uniref:hypothetical protein n=1 Tax=Sulfurospirillum arcachonense TaxID=57666 RepID=UPI00046B00FF|nr:hypothetical protein [Sulfurospirillum arcachonense]
MDDIFERKKILEAYIKGKDEDKFQILENIYLDTAQLLFKIDSDNISFPSEVEGNKTIAKVLSKDFNQKYDNVKTYYLSDDFSKQKWLVLMREKENENIRVGCGYYDWEFIRQRDNELKIKSHTIYIHEMLNLNDKPLEYLLNMQKSFAYPWADKNRLIEVFEKFKELVAVTNYLKINP